ncbi:hypothetical protein RFI_11495, partial [Reticulomyxa filosa]
KKVTGEELALQQKLVNSLRNELQEYKERVTFKIQLQKKKKKKKKKFIALKFAKQLAEKTVIKNEFEKMKVEIEQCKDANKQMDQTIKTKDELIKGLRSKCAQLTHQAYLVCFFFLCMYLLICESIGTIQSTIGLFYFAVSFLFTYPFLFHSLLKQKVWLFEQKQQVEDLKKQLADSKHIDIENTDEFKELNEVNDKLVSSALSHFFFFS